MDSLSEFEAKVALCMIIPIVTLICLIVGVVLIEQGILPCPMFMNETFIKNVCGF